MRIPKHPVTILLSLALSSSANLIAADATGDTGPLPEAVRMRFAEAAKGATLRDYAVEQRGTKTVYTAIIDDPATGRPQRIEVTADGSTARIEPIDSNDGTDKHKPPAPPAVDNQPSKTPGNVLVIPDEPRREDGKDAAPETRRGLEETPPGHGP